jgi:hypothetical protein
MKIISFIKGFTADHSSTSYEFLAIDKALGKQAKAEVAALSSRARPTARRVSFNYTVDGYDLPGGWLKLMEKYYDVMYTESYDWWTLALAFNTDPEQIQELKKYEFAGDDEKGVTVTSKGQRVIVAINCQVNAAWLADSDYEEEDEDDEDEYESDDDDDKSRGEEDDRFSAEDKLLDLLIQVRQQLMQRDYRALYAVWEQYGYSDDDEEEQEFQIPVPPDKKAGRDIVEQFGDILTSS